MKPVLIDTAAAMDDLLAALADEDVIAIDTEFLRETTYYPHLGLVQVASKRHVACIDPLAFDCAGAIRRLLENPACIKVFHACSQDLEVLYHSLHCKPSPLHDTQLAAALLGPHDQIGYARLIQSELGVSLAKTQTRTNWLKRPLTRSQIDYASDDVTYLLTCYHRLLDRLQQQGRLSWFREDCEALAGGDTPPGHIDTSQLWKRVKGHQKLNGIRLARIQSIASWRERLAMQIDRNRRRVLNDEIVISLSEKPPSTLQQLQRRLSQTTRLDHQQTSDLFDALCAAEALEQAEWPVNTFQAPDKEEKRKMRHCLDFIAQKAEALNLATTTLCPRKTLEKLLQGHTELNVLRGWRKRVFGDELLAQIRNL